MDRIYRLIKLNRRIRSNRLKFALALAAHLLRLRHLFIRLDPVFACNLRCRMCLFSNADYRRDNAGGFSEEEVGRLAGLFLPRAIQLMIGCGAEPTLYRDFTGLVKLGKSYGVPYVGFVTNGQLLEGQHLEGFIRCGLDELVVSVHGVTGETYESMMAGASFEKLHGLLEMLDGEKERLGSGKPALRINYTVNPDNLEELAGFFDTYGRYRVSTLQIRPVIDLGPTDYAFRDWSGHLEKYRETTAFLAGECRKRKVVFLAPRLDPVYPGHNPGSAVLEAVLRNISPRLVWRPDFRWREETCEDYCKRTGWTRYLLRRIITGAAGTETRSTSLTYDLDL